MMECEFCKRIEGDGDRPVNLYWVESTHGKKGQMKTACSECAKSKNNDRGVDGVGEVLFIPDGWNIIADIELKGFQDQKEALVKVSEEMQRAKHEPIGETYLPYPAGRLRDIFNDLNHRIMEHEAIRDSLGLGGAIPHAMLSGAYCPACRSPLLKMSELRADKSLMIAASKIAAIMIDTREERNGTVFVCLGCSVAYVEKQSKKRGKS